ncbi:MAG: DUF748 domain-containing protein [Bacteroidales bacterium]|nr:DUF748 domain-containing protein [Bacteroidales bacterium]
MKKGLKIVFITVGVIVGLLLLVSILAGPIVKWYAEKHSVELCHREATIGQVWINIFTGSVWIKDLKVQEENPKQDFLKFDELNVQVALPKMLSHKIQLNKIKLNGLDAKIIQHGIRFNFSDIIDFYVNKPKKEKKKEGKPWDVDLCNISIKNSKVVYEDANMGSHFDTRNIDIDIPRLYLAGNATKANIGMDFAQSGKMDLGISYNIQKGDFDGELKLTNFQIHDIQPYMENFLKVGKISGIANGKLKTKGSVKHIMDLVASGTLCVNNAKVTNADNTPLGYWSNFAIDIAKADLGNMDFQVNKIRLKDFVFHLDIFKDGNTFSRLFAQKSTTDTLAMAEVEDTTAQKSATSRTRPIKYKVKNVSVENGLVYYSDHSVSPQTQDFTVSNIKLNAQNLASGQLAPVSLTAKLGKEGNLTCSGHVDPMNLSSADLNISIKNLDITEFTPYSLYYLAYPVTDGLLSFDSKISILNNWLNSHNSLDIYRPTFGDKVKTIEPAAAKIPMKLAMYVITDRKGYVSMDLPVKGDISSPDFSFRKVIWKTFLNLIVKIAASPVDFLSHLGGDNPFKSMQLPADNVELSMENLHQLNEIANTMNEKQQSQLLLSIGCNPAVSDSTQYEAKSQQLRQETYSTIVNQLSSQGIPSSRVVLEDRSLDNVSADKVKVVFNITFSE